jgi:HEAT repeat protein
LTTWAAPGDDERAVRLSSPLLSLPTRCRAFCAAALVVALAGSARGANERQIREVEDALRHDPSFKVRVDAALILGRLREGRSLPALAGGLQDPQPAVRAASAEALGEIGSRLARDALAGALHDPEPAVRRSARAALRRLGADESVPLAPGEAGIRPHTAARMSFEVKPVGDPEHRAGAALRSHMRDFLVAELRPYGDVEALPGNGQYAVDGVIKTLSTDTGGRDVEVTCAVQLVLSRQPAGGVFMMSSGSATVQKAKRQWRPALRPSMELQALEAAVRGASEDLVAKLAER